MYVGSDDKLETFGSHKLCIDPSLFGFFSDILSPLDSFLQESGPIFTSQIATKMVIFCLYLLMPLYGFASSLVYGRLTRGKISHFKLKTNGKIHVASSIR